MIKFVVMFFLRKPAMIFLNPDWFEELFDMAIPLNVHYAYLILGFNWVYKMSAMRFAKTYADEITIIVASIRGTSRNLMAMIIKLPMPG